MAPIYLMFTYLEKGSTSVCWVFFILNAVIVVILK